MSERVTTLSGHVSITSQRTDDGEFRYRCSSMPDGRTPQLVGCSHNAPRSAMAHSDELTGRAQHASAPQSGQQSPRSAGPSGASPDVEDARVGPSLDPVPGSAHPESGVRSHHPESVVPPAGSGPPTGTLGL